MRRIYVSAILTCLSCAVVLCGSSAAVARAPKDGVNAGVLRGARTSGLANTAWPMARGGVRHTGRSPYRGPTRAVRKWTFYPALGVEDDFIGSAVVGRDGTAYVGCDNGLLYAIRPDGKKKWQRRLLDKIEGSPAIGADGTIYVVSYGVLFAVSPAGRTLWTVGGTYELNFCNRSSPAIGSDGTIYVGAVGGGGQASLVAVDPQGGVRWRCLVPWDANYDEFDANSSPAVGPDGTVYIGVTDYRLYAVSPDGQQKWVVDTGGRIADEAPAIGADGTIYVTTGDGSYTYGGADQVSGRLLSVSTAGDVNWSLPLDTWVYGAPAIGRDGTLYVNAQNPRSGHLFAITPAGKVKWKYAVPGMPTGSPTVSSDGLIFTCGVRAIYCVKSSGVKKWSWGARSMLASGGSPVIGYGGTLYFGSTDSYYALKGPAQR